MRHPNTPRARLLGTGRYLPAHVVENAEIAARIGSSDRWIREHTGIERRHVAGPGESTSDMAAQAAKNAMAAAGLGVADLDMIIVSTTTGDTPMPACAAHVQQKIGADLIPSFDLSASGAGFLYAVTLAEQFIATGKMKTVLVACAESATRRTNPDDRTTAALFGDGAGAAIVGPATGDGRGILASELHADGSLADLFSIPGGGSAEVMDEARVAAGRHFFHMDGRELYDVTVHHLTVTSMRALKSAGLTSAELDWVIPLQANRNIVDTISTRLGYARSKFIENVSQYGNTLSASIPIALDEAVRDGRIRAGQTVLLCGLGAGVAWGAMIVRM
jgi:3-oxoacyl-[acyl-carrier-protein] synthase-3